MVLFMFFDNAIKENPLIGVKRYPLFHYRSRRLHMILLLSISSFCTTYMMSSIDMTMTCMINSTAVHEIEQSQTSRLVSPSVLMDRGNSSGKCHRSHDQGDGDDIIDYGGSLEWTQRQQNFVFAGAFWGAVLSVLPSMFILQKFSVKYVFFGALLTYTISNTFFPLAAIDAGYKMAFVVRFILGMGDGFVTPSINTLISNWFPVSERSTALSLNAIGEQIAGIGESPLAAAFCQSSLGWPAVFYLGSIIGSLWCLLWICTSSDRPTESSSISDEEKLYLEVSNSNANMTEKQSWRDVPYKRILTSIPFLAQLQCHFFMCFAAALMGTYLPTFFKEVLLLGVMANGLYISLPNFFNLAAKVMWGVGFDKLKQLGLISPTRSAKVSQAVSSYGMALSFLGLAFLVDCNNPVLGLVFACILFSCQGIECSGFVTSLLSLAPRYTATLSCISLFTAQLGIVVTPYVMTALHSTSGGGWTAMFVTAAAACTLSGTIFIIFGSGDMQPWSETTEKPREDTSYSNEISISTE